MSEKPEFRHLVESECGPHCVAQAISVGKHVNIRHCNQCHDENMLAMEDRPAHGTNCLVSTKEEVSLSMESTDVTHWTDKPHTHAGTDCSGGPGCPALPKAVQNIYYNNEPFVVPDNRPPPPGLAWRGERKVFNEYIDHGPRAHWTQHDPVTVGHDHTLSGPIRIDEQQPRLKQCVHQWPQCEEGTYDPRCCRFPKSCSCRTYSPEYVKPEDLEQKE